ncbi:hypothetical protein F4779DRAFT_630169 [Xylariaceae sp. FL0662B]|nr:hypothetical protein F4779DRAFT_630169 [Xylariaceae sp. FL0662B]
MGIVSSVAGKRGGGTKGEEQLQTDDDGVKSKAVHTQTLWILIFRGHPNDIQSARATELHIVFDDDESVSLTVQIQGQHPNFTIREVWNGAHPRARPYFFRRLQVATVETNSERDMRIRNAILGTQVNNIEPDWTCQNWVGDVLTVLQEANLIAVEEGDNALNGMVNYISRAPWQ